MSARTEREFLTADLAKLDNLIEEMTDSDFLTRMGLESRRYELREALAAMEPIKHPLASVKLFFGGEPVIANRGIESEFGANMIASFQDIVSKVYAEKQGWVLGQRGPVAGKAHSKLHITHIVRGSFGFQLEELDDQPLFDSALKESVEQTTKIIASFDDLDGDTFGEAIEDIDSRILEDIRGFFETLQTNRATFRIASGVIDKDYNQQSLGRAIERAKITTINERDEIIAGKLLGILPEQRTFEYRMGGGSVIRGKIDMQLSGEDLSKLNLEWVQKDSKASFRVRDVLRQGNLYRQAYFLVAINS